MELKFQHALFAVGAFLLIFGASFALVNSPPDSSGGVFEAFEYGFTAIFIALFSGVLMGVGAALVICGLILGLRGCATHIALSFLFSVLSTLIAVGAVANTEGSTFPGAILFFAGFSSSAAFLLSAVAFMLSGAVHGYLAEKMARESAAAPANSDAQKYGPPDAEGNGAARRGAIGKAASGARKRK